MESKKLQQLQQANSHLAPQPMPQTKSNLYHQQSPVFQNHPQYQSLTSNFAQINLTQHPPHINQPQLAGHLQNSQQQPLLQQQSGQQHYHGGEQLYQSTTNRASGERVYQQGRYPPQHNHGIQSSSALQAQWQQLQQAKMHQQIKTQNDALIQQQRTFAMRQQLNPPIPQSHYHIQSQAQTPVNSNAQRIIPPSSLNLTNQFQPAPGPIPITQNVEQIYGTHLIQAHKTQNQAIYQQNQQIQQQLLQNKLQQRSQSVDPNQIIIHQNHPNLVVNQACQTQLSGTVLKAKSPPDTPQHQPLEKKKSGGGQIHVLKSPVTKRPTAAQVTLSGWLYKQGSEGLKVWRKRWFVLSEYCLYYYKGPEEEKLLGSILLPSYRVAACSPEDKIYKKFAFKCEHANMRTYWLAGESTDSMGQWVRALIAATMMQGSCESDQTSQPSVSSLNPSNENSDSGIHTYQSQQSKLSVPIGPLTPDGPQPLYANAPPKPRRANDGGYSSPSPENSIERYDPNYDAIRHDTTIHGRRNDVKSPHLEPVYDTRQKTGVKSPDPTMMRIQQQIRLDNNKSPGGILRQQTRSPYPQDGGAYPQQPQSQIPQTPQELVYHATRDNIIRAPQRFNDDFNAQEREKEIYMHRLAQQQQIKYQIQQSNMYPNAERRTPDTYGRSRPGQQDRTRNMADYEDIYNLQQQAAQQQTPEIAYRRPMSPVGYNDPNSRLIQTRYPAEPNATQHVQMRARPAQTTLVPRPHSADFLEYEARNPDQSRLQPEKPRAPRPKSSLDINRTPDSYYYSEASYAEKMRQSAVYLQKSPNPKGQTTENNSSVHSNSIPRESDFDRAQRLGLNETAPQVASVPRVTRSSAKNIALQQEQFLRSASARLPRKEEDMSPREGERKREESMKRLLEWKQRMLQSPLTRKGAPMAASVVAKSVLTQKIIGQGLQRSRSETNANAGYNSYSSDDEGEFLI